MLDGGMSGSGGASFWGSADQGVVAFSAGDSPPGAGVLPRIFVRPCAAIGRFFCNGFNEPAPQILST